MKMLLSEIARVTKAENDYQRWADVEITSVDFDTRELQKGALFVPLNGERDGHDFIENAFAQGAAATFFSSDHQNPPTDRPVLVVADPLKAMQALAQYYLLLKVNPKVVAITGSNGKTTTKDMTATVLSTQFRVHKTKDNFNNEIGIPMTILSMPTNTEILVVEMGMDRPGQLDYLSQLVQPDVAVITMIGEAHIEFFGTRDRIADAKMEITHGLKADGTFIYDGDEPLLTQRAKDLEVEMQRFGGDSRADLYPTKIASHRDETQFIVNQWPDLTFSIPLMGTYNVNNALAALLVGKHFHVPAEKMQQALLQLKLTKNRTEWLTGTAGEAILSDVYNANPTAMREVLRSFSQVPLTGLGRRIVVLGDMLELGSASHELHESVATAINPQRINEVYLYGSEMQYLYQKLQIIYSKSQLHYYPTAQQAQLTAALITDLTPEDNVLLKASHGLYLENVLNALMKR